MPRKPEAVATPNVIKWTEEEWQMIASRLLEEKGRGLLGSAQLEEVKAKDVFNAQNVLPEGRHRKLISISQGFQAIRQRLHGIMQDMETGFRDTLPKATTSVAHEVPRSSGNLDDGARQKPHERNQDRTGEEAAVKPADVSQHGVAEKVEDNILETQDTAAVYQSGATLSEPIGKQVRHTASGIAPSSARRPVQDMTASQRLPHRNAPARSASDDLIELARPFIAMVCEEFANALVKTMAERGGNQAAAALQQTAMPVTPSAALQKRRDVQSVAPPGENMSGSRSESLPQATQAADDEDAHSAETDVQPLFDPKLPPSANSAFKPIIALLGTSTHDFEYLKQLYPQLELNVVALDDLRTAPSLRNCQRMIGLRENIPAPADEFLRKTFRNRYVRVNGGIAQIRDQLNTWLDTPGTMNTGAPNRPRKQGNGKGPGTGNPKKKQFRRPNPNP